MVNVPYLFSQLKFNINIEGIGLVRTGFNIIQPSLGKEISVYYAIIPMPVSTHAITAIRANTGFLDFHRK